MREMTAKCFVGGLLAAGMMLTGGTADAAQKEQGPSFYYLEELSPDVALEGTRFYLATGFGPTGLTGWLLGSDLVVREVDKGSPADGLIEPNDVIQKLNGLPLGEDPIRTLGEQIMESEKTGKLSLDILRAGRRTSVSLPLRKLGAMGSDWPVNCGKSKQILADAAAFLARQQNPDGGFDTNTTIAFGLAGLTWLAADDPAYFDNCRRLIQWFLDTNHVDLEGGNPAWGSGYVGTFFAEYYLVTGDRSVLPACRIVAAKIAELQDPRGGWTHGGPGGYGYVQGGLMNPAGAGCWLALELLEECGIREKAALAKARHYFMRFVDNGTLPYGDHRPEFNGTGNSKDALACLALWVKGEADAAGLFGRLVTDYPDSRTRGHTGGFLGFCWGHVAGNFNPHRPDYRRCLDHWNWLLHAGRRWDGGFHMPPSVTGNTYMFHGLISNTGGPAMLYGVPNRNLRIFGRTENVFAGEKKPRQITAGLKLYRDLKFDKLRETVTGDTPEARQLLKAAAMKERDLALTIKKAETELAGGNPLGARLIAKTLGALCEGRLERCDELVREADSDTCASIRRAAEIYEANRWIVYTRDAARKAIEKLAAAKDAGIYASLSRELLATPADARKWVYSSTLLYDRYWPEKEKDELAMDVIKRLAHIKGSNWTSWHPMNWLRENGHIVDTFVREWTPLLPVAAMHEGCTVPRYTYCGGSTPEGPAGWREPECDPDGWLTEAGPLSNARESALKPVRGASHHFFRIPFKVSKKDLGAWSLYMRHQGSRPKAVLYLNGHCIAWVDELRGEYRPVELVPSALRFLKEGENLLAIRTTGSNKHFEVGIYAKENAR